MILASDTVLPCPSAMTEENIMALTADRNTPSRDGELVAVPMAASTTIYGGGMVGKNAAGYTVPGADVAGLTIVGVADGYAHNSGDAGDEDVLVRRKRAFCFANDATNPCTVAHLFTSVYVVDEGTVSSDGGTNSIVAGKMLALDDAGVIVEI